METIFININLDHIMNQDVYFPMRSNIEFFEKKSNQPSLISKIKQSILMYENLYFDVGAYTLSCNERLSFEVYTPPEGIKNLDFDIPENAPDGFFLTMQEEPNGRPFSLASVEEKGKSYRVCFQKLLEDIGLQGEDFIKLGTRVLTTDGERILKKLISHNNQYKKYIESPGRCKDNILKNLYLSLLASESSETPIIVDNLHNQIIQKLTNESIKQDQRLEVLNSVLNTAENHIIDIEIPDFSLMDIDTLLDYKKDKVFKNFRSKILELNTVVAEKDVEQFNKIIMGEVITELSSQLQEIAPSQSKLLIKLFTGVLGLFPGVSELLSAGNVAYDTIQGAKDLYHYENSWLTFILTYQK
jgi:hypothetical protein